MQEKIISIIGLGLIGGSIAKAISVNKKNYKIYAFDTDKNILLKAFDAGLIDYYASNLPDAVKNADIVILCTPVCSMISAIEEMSSYFKKGAILSDVGSCKGFLEDKLRSYLPEDVSYIGGHPMAGSEKSGLNAADVNLFIGRPFVLIPSKNTDEKVLNEMVDFVKDLRAIPVFLDSITHDLATAMLSHMPHILSTSLMVTAVNDEMTNKAKYLSAGCFRDMTRVSGADPRMWTDVSLANSDAILEQLDKLQELLDEAKVRIKNKDEEWLMDFFVKGREGREKFGMFVTDEKGM